MMKEIESLIARATSPDIEVAQKHEAFGELVKRFQDMVYGSGSTNHILRTGAGICSSRMVRKRSCSTSTPPSILILDRWNQTLPSRFEGCSTCLLFSTFHMLRQAGVNNNIINAQEVFIQCYKTIDAMFQSDGYMESVSGQ